MTDDFTRPIPLNKIDFKKGYKDQISATEAELDSLCDRFDLLDIGDLNASFVIKMQADRMTYHITGQVTADVTQHSIISGDAVPKAINQPIETWMIDRSKILAFEDKHDKPGKRQEVEMPSEKDDPEVITDGIIDLGALAAEFLGLALEDYPRTAEEGEGAGDYIEATPGTAKNNPFAKLAALKKED